MTALMSKNDYLGILPKILIRICIGCAYAEYLDTKEVVNRDKNYGQEERDGCPV
jgi:hypothetical protein